MKVLFLSQGRTIETHPGWEWSLRKLKEEGFIEDYLNIPWVGYSELYGFDALYSHVINEVKAHKYDVVFFHYFHNGGRPSPEACIRELKELPVAPTILTSVGDGFSSNWQPPNFPHEFQGAAREADIIFSIQMGGAARKIHSWRRGGGGGIVVLSPHSLCPARFKAYEINPETHKFDFDVVMIGSKNGRGKNPMNKFSWGARERQRLVFALAAHFGRRFAVFGRGWGSLPSAQGPVAFDDQQKAMMRGRVVVGGSPYSYADYYMSNRPFFEVASGIPTIELRVPRVDKILREGDQVYFADSISDIIVTCERLLHTNPKELYAKAARAAKEIASRHTQYNRLKFQLSVAREFQLHGNKMEIPFDFFLPEVDLTKESTFACMRSEQSIHTTEQKGL